MNPLSNLLLPLLLTGVMSGSLAKDASPAAVNLPRFTGGIPPYADTKFHDGRFRPAVGVQNIEILRGNRTHPEWLYDMSKMVTYPDAGFDKVGFACNHAPMLCYWKGRFWLEYLS